MRNPERIFPFLARLAEVWGYVPDWRFGQLVLNLSRNPDGSFGDPWEWEEEEWRRRIENLREALVGSGMS